MPDKNKQLRNGDTCWIWHYEWPDGMPTPSSQVRPMECIVAARTQCIGSPDEPSGWYVPVGPDGLSWVNARGVGSVNACADRKLAVRQYNDAVRTAVKKFTAMANLARSAFAR